MACRLFSAPSLLTYLEYLGILSLEVLGISSGRGRRKDGEHEIR